MENFSWTEYKISVRERLRIFALQVLDLSETIPKSIRGKVVNHQLTKSGTSAYATYRAGLRARSKAEFFSKLSIAVEEVDETEMWIELLIASNIIKGDKVKELHSESIELIKILASMRKRLSDNSKR
ncbi:four helix bundle protein [Aestuariivivens insulae]|uniref:four helix bundle protein n=1 Tax=Aestuariivivens insulae TaxID=1621988 RepID=UPI001F59B5EA|nr:four helix bundle protein [Aestuariivivens insulae]